MIRSISFSIFFWNVRQSNKHKYWQPSVGYDYLASLETNFHPVREYAQRDYKIFVRREWVLKRADESKWRKWSMNGNKTESIFVSEISFVSSLPSGTCVEPPDRMQSRTGTFYLSV